MKAHGWSGEKLTICPDRRNEASVIDMRGRFCSEMTLISNNHCFFLDETGFNLHMDPLYGRSLVGDRAQQTRPANRGRKVSVLCVIGGRGVIAHKIMSGSFNLNIL